MPYSIFYDPSECDNALGERVAVHTLTLRRDSRHVRRNSDRCSASATVETITLTPLIRLPTCNWATSTVLVLFDQLRDWKNSKEDFDAYTS